MGKENKPARVNFECAKLRRRQKGHWMENDVDGRGFSCNDTGAFVMQGDECEMS